MTPGTVSRYRFFAAEGAAVMKGQVVAERIDTATGSHGIDVTGRIQRFDSPAHPELVAATGAIIEEPKGRFVALHYGRLRFLGDGVSVRPLLRISGDGLAAEMEAFASFAWGAETAAGTLEPITRPVTAALLRQALQDAGIVADLILDEAVELLAQTARKIPADNHKGARRVVARGRPAQKGRDAEIRFLFAGRDAAPEAGLRGETRVLAREVALPGQILAVKTPATAGTPGITVRGNPIAAEPGADLELQAGAGIDVDGHGLVFRLAGSDPAIPVVQGGVLQALSLVAVAEDLLEATFPAPECPPALVLPGRAELEAAMARAGVCFGIDAEAVAALAARAGETWTEGETPVVVARGDPPVHGAAAVFTSHIEEKNRFAGAANDQEKVDFREMIHSRSVETGRLLGTRTPPAPGVRPGTSVLGTKLPCLPGEDKTPTAGRGVELSADGCSYLASADGIYTYTPRAGLVEVLKNYVVAGDVDYSVGRINSACMVTVEGKVAPGFAVCADGPVYVAGSVEGAVIRSKAEVFIGGGIYFLQNAEVHAGGDVDVAIVDRALIRAGGDLRVRREAINADLRTLGKLTIGPGQGRAVGGALRAAERIEAAVLGSELGVPMEVEVGANVSLDTDDPVAEPEGGWAALIPRGGIYPGRVRVLGEVYPGVVIRILNWSFEVREKLYSVEFVLDSNWRIEPRAFR